VASTDVGVLELSHHGDRQTALSENNTYFNSRLQARRNIARFNVKRSGFTNQEAAKMTVQANRPGLVQRLRWASVTSHNGNPRKLLANMI
jgi:hypothetical protein